MSPTSPPSATALARRSAAWSAPVLSSAAAASPHCVDVTVDLDRIGEVADWMRFELFAPVAGGDGASGASGAAAGFGSEPDLSSPDPERPSLGTREEQIDFTVVTTAINFAYTDFETGIPWSIVEDGVELVDADAMFRRFEQAYAAGVPVLSGAWLSALTTEQLASVLHGPRQIPLLEERVRVLRGLGAVLEEKYSGSFAVFVRDCPPLAFADGTGLLDRLVAEFPNFDDVSTLHGVPVSILKLGQLCVWTLHRLGLVQLRDLDSLAVFADYIVPAALRTMRVLTYSPALAAAVDSGQIVPAGSDWENEIRVQTIFACGLLTEELNVRRSASTPPLPPLVNPQLDYRLWAAFHDLIRPHHLTVTTRY